MPFGFCVYIHLIWGFFLNFIKSQTISELFFLGNKLDFILHWYINFVEGKIHVDFWGKQNLLVYTSYYSH